MLGRQGDSRFSVGAMLSSCVALFLCISTVVSAAHVPNGHAKFHHAVDSRGEKLDAVARQATQQVQHGFKTIGYYVRSVMQLFRW